MGVDKDHEVSEIAHYCFPNSVFDPTRFLPIQFESGQTVTMDDKINDHQDHAVTHVENKTALEVVQAIPDTKHVKVLSVALTDALVTDNPSLWSASMIKLYAIMLLVTLSKFANS